MHGSVCEQCGYRAEQNSGHYNMLPVHTILHSRYIIGRMLGKGGFGITYKAYDLERQIICALKEYMPRFLELNRKENAEIMLTEGRKRVQYEHGKKRFREEAEILSRIQKYPYIVRMWDSFEENNTYYYVMEFVDGLNLKQLVQDNGYCFSEKEATEIMLKIGSTLQVIFEKEGLIHRDISPENILIDKYGEYKLIDFGSAKEVDPAGRQGISVVLKQGFAPLEQYSETMPQGSYTDVYALAGTYYYLTTRKKVPGALERLGGCSDYIPLCQLNRSVSKTASDAVDRALALKYKERTQTIRRFLEELTATNSGIAVNTVFVSDKQDSVKVGYLKIIGGRYSGKRWDIPDDGKARIVGRDSNKCHIVIEYGSVSGKHLEIRFESISGRFWGKDYSRNGTVVDDQYICNGEFQAMNGSEIHFPGTDCIVRLGVE